MKIESNGREYFVVTGVIGDPSKGPWYPWFKVRLAGQRPEEELHRRDHDEWDAPFPTQAEALEAAAKAAREWIEAHGDEKGNG